MVSVPVIYVVLWVFPLLFTPGEGSPPPVDPREILTKANAAAEKLTAITYEAEFRGEGAFADKTPVAKGKVSAARAAEGKNLMYRVEGMYARPGTTQGASIQFASDGEKAYLIDESSKVCKSGIADVRRIPQVSALMPPKFLHDSPFKQELESRYLSYEGVESADGVACDVVRVAAAASSPNATRFFFGQKDNLLRRLENNAVLRMPGRAQPESGRIIWTVTILDARPKLEEDYFRLPCPDGYTSESFEEDPLVNPRGLLAAGTPAPDWELKNAKGEKVSLKELRGKVVVLDFWASWCQPCKLGMPALEELHLRFKGSPVAVLGVNCRQRGLPVQDALDFVKQKKLTYEQLVEGDKVAQDYRVTGIPCIYVIDAQGKVAYATSGYQPKLHESIGALINSLLKK